MKRFYTPFAVLMLLLLVAACGKYEEGPGFSLRSKKARVSNIWGVQSILINGADSSAAYSDYQIVFTKTGGFNVSVNDNEVAIGSWDFANNNESLSISAAGIMVLDSMNTIVRLKNGDMKVVGTSSGNEIELLSF